MLARSARRSQRNSSSLQQRNLFENGVPQAPPCRRRRGSRAWLGPRAVRTAARCAQRRRAARACRPAGGGLARQAGRQAVTRLRDRRVPGGCTVGERRRRLGCTHPARAARPAGRRRRLIPAVARCRARTRRDTAGGAGGPTSASSRAGSAGRVSRRDSRSACRMATSFSTRRRKSAT